MVKGIIQQNEHYGFLDRMALALPSGGISGTVADINFIASTHLLNPNVQMYIGFIEYNNESL
jgi:hypothetical protein